MNYFYDHLILIDEITSALDSYDLSSQEREELLGLIHQTTHHHILHIILNHLPKPHHENFLTKFQATPHDPELLAFFKAGNQGRHRIRNQNPSQKNQSRNSIRNHQIHFKKS